MSAPKRTKVRTALHSELSEYSSLLRALRTSNTLDLTSHLTAHSAIRSTDPGVQNGEAGSDPDLSSVEDDDRNGRPQTEPASSTVVSGGGGVDLDRHKTRIQGKIPRKIVRDTWTRWPLMTDDVHVPEWSLEDEVRLLASQCLSAQCDVSSGQDCSTLEETVESLLTPHVLRALADSSGSYLSEILALLAAHIPQSGGSMQNRVRPMNWESVLTIAATGRLLSPDALQAVQSRLLDVYPSSTNSVLHKYESVDAKPSEAKFDFLVIDGYDGAADSSTRATLRSAAKSLRSKKAARKKKKVAKSD